MSRPMVLSLFKPARITSYDLVRRCKRTLGQQGIKRAKIGHFGTLDPFASGLMLVGLFGASRLNNFIHQDLTKTYLAIGKLGVETPTGDLTVAPNQMDQSRYLYENIAKFDRSFLQDYLQKFVGDYWQSPHPYSAAKFQGKALHLWAREGKEIKKEPVRRHIWRIEVLKYRFPYLILRCEVSSGTYVRTLFRDIARELGTLGVLVSLVREKIGSVSVEEAFHLGRGPEQDLLTMGKVPLDKLLPYAKVSFPADRVHAFGNGLSVLDFQATLLSTGSCGKDLFWAYDEEGQLLGLAQKREGRYWVKINFPR